MSEIPQLLTEAEAASHLRVCQRTLRNIRVRGEIHYVQLTTGKVLYLAADIVAYIDKCRRQPTPVVADRSRRVTARTGPSERIIPFTERRAIEEARKNRELEKARQINDERRQRQGIKLP